MPDSTYARSMRDSAGPRLAGLVRLKPLGKLSLLSSGPAEAGAHPRRIHALYCRFP